MDDGVAHLDVDELTRAPTTEPLAHGPARNPWSLGHTTGGSSGGSAAAVAAGLLSPTMPRLPIELGVADPTRPVDGMHAVHGDMAALALPLDVTGRPAATLPLATGPGGLPVGVQLVVPYGGEDLLVRLGSARDEAAPGTGRRPALADNGAHGPGAAGA